jgi:BA14K-like protein
MSEKPASIIVGLEKAVPVLLTAFVFAALMPDTPAFAGDFFGFRPLRYGDTSGWHFDARNDDRDVPTNGVFPGNFAASPPLASIGAAGFLESNSYRSPRPYPSQVYFGPVSDRSICARRYRSYDRASGTYLGKDGLRHPCTTAPR